MSGAGVVTGVPIQDVVGLGDVISAAPDYSGTSTRSQNISEDTTQTRTLCKSQKNLDVPNTALHIWYTNRIHLYMHHQRICIILFTHM